MGMGEPFLNYERVINAADILHDHNGFGLGAKRITISTSGIVPMIDRFVKEKHKYKLAISLNATDDNTRKKLCQLIDVGLLMILLNQHHDLQLERIIM